MATSTIPIAGRPALCGLAIGVPLPFWVGIARAGTLIATAWVLDVGAVLAVGGAFLGTFGWLTTRHALLPVGDLRLAESMASENG